MGSHVLSRRGRVETFLTLTSAIATLARVRRLASMESSSALGTGFRQPVHASWLDATTQWSVSIVRVLFDRGLSAVYSCQRMSVWYWLWSYPFNRWWRRWSPPRAAVLETERSSVLVAADLWAIIWQSSSHDEIEVHLILRTRKQEVDRLTDWQDPGQVAGPGISLSGMSADLSTAKLIL